MFLPTILFNSEAWSHLTAENVEKLQIEQLRYLKRIMSVPRSTSNSFVFLELGFLPIKYEIARRQLVFLHHILNLDKTDPVLLVYKELGKFTYEKNWANSIRQTLFDLDIFMSDEEIAPLSKSKWKGMVKRKVREKAFSFLSLEASKGSKTASIYYEKLAMQRYVTDLPPRAAQQIFRLRSRTVSCKANQKERFKNDLSCRSGCGTDLENQQHVVNCTDIHGNVETLDTEFLLGDFDVKENYGRLISISKRVTRAYEFFHEE